MAKKSQTFENDVLEQSGEDIPEEKPKKIEPSYRIMGPKIIVSKAFGKNVEKKKSAAITSMEAVREAWDEAYRYYNHDQVKESERKNQPRSGAWWRRGDSYENLVFANTSVMIPSIYAKNPDVYFETDQDEDKDFVKLLSKAVNSIFTKPDPYGVNLKPRMKKAALHAELTNLGILKLDYVEKAESIQGAEEEMMELTKRLEKAKNVEEVKKIEGQIMALESNIEYMEPSGFKLKSVVPTNLIIDPFAENEDGSDANWMLEEAYISTNFLNAKFTDEKKGGRATIYKPTHKLCTDGEGQHREDALGMALEAIEEGVGDQDSHMDEGRQNYIYENMTKCWYYWDKPTRRLYLFEDKDFTWPIWVWEDPLKTTRFFPYYFVQFYPSTGGVCAPGEVSFYLDQQDEINEINREVRKARRMAFNVIMFNSNKIKRDDAMKLANYLKDGVGENMLGIDVPDGMSIKDCVETLMPPSMNHEVLFNKEPIYASIDRIGSVSDAIRGQQFKTNTTEDAVQAYTSAAQLRLGNRTDAIEECVQQVAWSIAEILVSREDREFVSGLIGETVAQEFKFMSVAELNYSYSVQVAAGSSEKPTSVFKKKEAVEIAQSLGQFAKAAPGSTLRVVLKLLQKAFPELEITEEDWNSITEEMQAVLQRGVSTGAPGQAPEAGSGPAQNGAAPPEAQSPTGNMSKEQIEQLLLSLPPEAQQQIIQAVQNGVPASEAIKPFIGAQGNGNQPPG